MRIKARFWGITSVILLLSTWAGSSHATVGKPMVVYSENETASIQSSQFTSSTSSWSIGATASTTSRKQYWKVARTHPKGNKKAVVSVENPASGDPYLYAALWDESNWDDGTGASYSDVKQLGQVYTNSYRCFDAAYEETSGKLLVVAASPTANTIKYWTWNGSTWSTESTYTFSNTLGNINWRGKSLTLGEVTSRAKSAGIDMDIRRTSILFGHSTRKLNPVVALGSPAGNTSNALECGFSRNRMGRRGLHPV